MPEKSANQLAIPVHTSVPDQLKLEHLQKNLQHSELSAFQKRVLRKQGFKMQFEQRREQFNASLEIEKYRLNALVDVVKSKIAVEKDTVALNIRNDYLVMMTDLGANVEMQQLEFITAFDVRLKAFRKSLENKDLDPEEKERILDMSRRTFDRIYNRLMELADRMIPMGTDQHA